MNKNDLTNFEFIFNSIICPIVKQIEKEADEEFKKQYNLRIKDLNIVSKKCEMFYQNKREELKKIFYGNKYSNVESDDESFCLDLHKIGAIICYSLIKHKVFIFDFDTDKVNKIFKNDSKEKSTDWIISNVLINYKLAFHFSVAFMYYKMIFDADNENCEELRFAIEEQKGLSLYKEKGNSESEKRHESFSNSVILDLFKRDVKGRSFDYFMYATLLFQLEEYNKVIFRNKSNIKNN